MYKHSLLKLTGIAALLLLPVLALATDPATPAATMPAASAADIQAASKLIQPLPHPVKMTFCIFDLEGEHGDIATMAGDIAKDAQAWNLFATVKIYTNEGVLAEDFKAGQCDGAAMSTLRAKQFNRVVGSIDAPGNLPDYEALKLLLQTLATPQIATLGINGKYQVVGVVPIGAIFVMVNDRSINSIEKAAGKRVVVLDWDKSEAKMISSMGAQPVPADLTNYSAKFNNGQADIIAAPAMAYQPLELYKGIGSKGGIINFPLLQATGTILIRRDFMLPKIPDLDNRLAQLRQFGLNHLDSLIRVFTRTEQSLPKNLWINLAAADATRYQNMLREARLHLTHEGVYEPVMMSILKRVRCKQDASRAECALFDE
jgi:hypothetical protein